MRVDEIGTKTPVQKQATVIHNVHIIDASGSMAGGKYDNAIKGVQMETEELKKAGSIIKYTNTIVEFSGDGKSCITTHCLLQPLEKYRGFDPRGADGYTPLYQAVGETIENLLRLVKKGEKVLIKVFTDGGENSSTGIYRKREVLSKLIEKVQEENEFTVTFVGTETDVQHAVYYLGVDASNTLVHDNTERGIAQTYKMSTSATQAYSKRVSKGEDVKKNFYSKSVVKEEKK